MSQIEIYKGENGQTQIDVKFEEDTVWLSQKQIAAVFGTEVPAINKHIKNIIREGELKKNSTISKMEIVQQEGKRKITRQVEIYNLDLIISVGYRVNSVRATQLQFRIWATQRLKDYLVNGLAVNKKRLEQLQQVVNIIQQSGNTEELNITEAKGLLEIIASYTASFVLLNQYDSNTLSAKELKPLMAVICIPP